MPQGKETTADCTNCGSKISVEKWDFINGTTNPRAKKMLLNGSLFKYKCKKCGTMHFADYPFFYSDTDKNFAVYYLNDAERASETNDSFKTLGDMVLDKYPDFKLSVKKHRIVTSYNAMLEKITIFENDLDDGAVEIMKLIYLEKVLKEYPGISINEVLFYIKNDEYLLQFNSEDEPLIFEADKTLLSQITEQFADQIAEKSTDCYMVNTIWARDLMNSLK